ncbi:MAG: PIN domain-containing protein [Gemmataceae bacterium]
MNAVDTNILIYSLDRNEPAKQLKAQQLLLQLRSAAEPTFLLWQVLGESVRQLRRWRDQGQLTDAEFLQHIKAFRYLFPILLPTVPVLDRALDFVQRFSLVHWDSMILGTYAEAGVTKLYTEDMGAPRTVDGIELVNPLL